MIRMKLLTQWILLVAALSSIRTQRTTTAITEICTGGSAITVQAFSVATVATRKHQPRINNNNIYNDEKQLHQQQHQHQTSSYYLQKFDFMTSRLYSTPSSSASSSTDASNSIKDNTDDEIRSIIQSEIQQLKIVLEREYLSFFQPMEKEWYNPNVMFIDPLSTLSGIDSYEKNVQMLSGRTLLGQFLFGGQPKDGQQLNDARILLHIITGGEVSSSISNTNTNEIQIQDIITRWTLQFKFKALPWQPIAKFSGISRYQVRATNTKGTTTTTSTTTKDNKRMIQIIRQDDFWDSINLLPYKKNQYEVVDKSIALQHFIDLLRPDVGFTAIAAGPELPYVTLRYGRLSPYKKPLIGQYEVRRYPPYIGIQIQYNRRDEGYTLLGSLTKGMNPLAPALVTVGTDSKTMLWPLQYLMDKNQDNIPTLLASIRQKIVRKLSEDDDDDDDDFSSSSTNTIVPFEIVYVPEKVIAIGRFTDAIVEPIVKKVHEQLLNVCEMDGLIPKKDSNEDTSSSRPPIITFAQYDAVYSMGTRRSEIHIELEPNGGHPW